MDDRFTICNMAIEAGAKNGIFPVDDKTMNYIKGRVNREVTAFEADADAEYEQTIEIDLSALRPTVACPHLPENTKTIDELGHIEVRAGRSSAPAPTAASTICALQPKSSRAAR